jgi:hypothetical protein
VGLRATPLLSCQFSLSRVWLIAKKAKSRERGPGLLAVCEAAVQGTVAQFGTWSVDEASKTLIVRQEGSIFPNAIGTESKSPSP